MKNLIALIALFVVFTGYSGNGGWTRRVGLTELMTTSYSIFEPQRSSGEDTRTYNAYKGFVRLNYARDEFSDKTHGYDWALEVKFTYLSNGSTLNGTLSINNFNQYEDYQEVPIAAGAFGYDIKIVSVLAAYGTLGSSSTPTSAGTPQTSTFIPDDIDLTLEMRTERIYELNKVSTVLTDIPYVRFVTADYTMNWNYLEGAEQYDVEWVFIDKYSPEYAQVVAAQSTYSPNELSPFVLPFQVQEPARVRVWGHTYTIDKAFPEGLIYFRVRPVSVFADQTNGITENIRTGKWGYFTTTQPAICKYEVLVAGEFELNKNWLYSVKYAEDGKSVSNLTYYDGSNKGRQNLIYNTSDNVTLVGESKYDFEGRPTVQVMPAPVRGRLLEYKPSFNLASLGNTFDEGEIEAAVTPPLSTLSGAAKYFSKDNDFTDDLFRNAIPDAGGYVFSQSIYKNDGSGRIESAGDIGADFTVSGAHASRMYYGTPTAVELKRLFGDNVPDVPDGYRKNMVRDENGQLSVTYFDKRGQTIATALAGDSPTSLRKLDYAEENITTPLNDNNVRIGNSMISEHSFLNAVPGNQVAFSYNLAGIVNTLAAQSVVVDDIPIPFSQFCATCAYTLKIEVKNAQGVVIGTPLTANISSATACTAASYNNTTYAVTLPEIGEYRIIKTLTIDEASMIAAFAASLEQQGSNYQTFLDTYLETVDVTGCFTDCGDWCFYTVRLNYIKENGEAAWELLTKAQQQALVSQCTAVACDAGAVIGNDPIDIDPGSACETQRQRMLHQLSPGGIAYDNPSSYLWTAIGSGYGGYTSAQLHDEANFTPAMAVALLPLHRENCMLQPGKCESWMAVMNSANTFTILAMSATWQNSGIFATPYNVSYDPASSALGMYTQLVNKVAGYTTTATVFSGNSCSGANGSLSSGASLFAYVDFYIDRYVALQACSNVPMSTDQVTQLKKQFFISLYIKMKWEFVRSNIGCPLFDDQDAIYLIPSSQGSIEDIVNDLLTEVANGKTCHERAIDNVNNWISQLSSECRDALGLSSFQPVPDYTGIVATAYQTNYPNGTSPTLAQLFYNYTRATCADDNSLGLFFDPGTGNPGKNWYDAITTALAVSGCDYTSGSDLPFASASPSFPAIAYTSYQPADLLAAVKGAIISVLSCSTCTESALMGCTSSDGLMGYNYSSRTQNVSINGYTGTIKMIRSYSTDYYAQIPPQYYQYSFQFTLSNGNCTFSNNYAAIVCNTVAGNIFFKTTTGNITSSSAATYVNAMGLQWDNESLLKLKWDPTVVNYNGSQNIAYSTLNSACTGSGSVVVSPETDFGILSSVVTDCIDLQMLQAEADAQVAYNQVIADLWTQFYAKMNKCLDVTEDFRMTYKLKEYQYMLYYYDLASNLVQTVPPSGVNPFTQTQVATFYDNIANNEPFPRYPGHALETVYKYNGMNALVASYTPDAGRTDLYLDRLYRVRFSQDAQQLTESKFSYSKYDELGRVAESGEFKKLDFDGLDVNANNAAYPSAGVLDYTHTFYEDAYYLPSSTANNPYPVGLTIVRDNTLTGQFGSSGQENLRNVAGAVVHRQADYNPTTLAPLAGTEIVSIVSYSYDLQKNVKRMVSTNNHLKDVGYQHKATDYKYDLISGNVEEVIYQDNDFDEYHHQYQYNANNRIIRALTSHNGDYWELDVKYFYYLHGPLARRELGHDKVQGTDYAYNLQGWIKGVNSTTLDRTRDIGLDGSTGDNQHVGLDAAGFSLGYYSNDYKAIKDAAEGTDNVLNNYFAITSAVANQNDNPDFSNADMSSLYNGNITHMVTAIRDLSENKLEILANNYQYDQLQRVREVKAYATSTQAALQTNNAFTGATLYRPVNGESAFQEYYTFDKNGNLLSLHRNGSGKNSGGTTIPIYMDNFSYEYTAGTNRLSKVVDNIPASNYAGDIDPTQANNNYTYNAVGQLIGDVQEQIQSITWTATGKVKKITFTSAGKAAGKHDVKFIYDPLDRRIAKLVYMNEFNSEIEWTYHCYDASANVMATYKRTRKNTSTSGGFNYYTENYSISEHPVYGTERVGLEYENYMVYIKNYKQTANTSLDLDVEVARGWSQVTPELSLPSSDYTRRVVGDKNFQLTNHIGNVLAVVTDRKIRYTDNGTVVYAADVTSFSDYSPYGTMLDNRHGQITDYRYGFQGQEADDEIKGEGNSYNYEFRMHDPRIGRFFAVDPLTHKYPWYTPYQFSGNKLISYRELEGLEEFKSYADYKKAFGSKAMSESEWNKDEKHSDGAWLKSDRLSKNAEWKMAMAAITKGSLQGRFKAFQQIKDYYHYIDEQLEAAGHEIRWTNGANYLVDELSLIFDEGGMNMYLNDAYSGAYMATYALTKSTLLAGLAGTAARNEMLSVFNTVKPLLASLNVKIADYAIVRFNDLLYGAHKDKKLQGMDAYWYDVDFIKNEQLVKAKTVYSSANPAALQLLNLFFNYGEFNPYTTRPIPVPSGINLTDANNNLGWGEYGGYGRVDVPLMMLWPEEHSTRTLSGDKLEKQFYNSGVAGSGGGNSSLYNKYLKVSKKIN